MPAAARRDLPRARPVDARPTWANMNFSWPSATHRRAEVGVLGDLHRTRAPV
ncbi:MAG TPA: hypothetical protein VFH36_11725 [Acidimicrobiales bacterium]|nr:hypothetical protein [Acidimicrobiales bacterium]